MPHTPGPWQFYELPGSTPDGVGYIRPDPEDGREIAHHGDTRRSREENCDNACLIIAAPELLELVQLFGRSVEYEVAKSERAGDTEGVGMKRITLDLIRAAIAKATGESA